ncbi:MAG TPA: hypothetical protein VGC07_08285 [Granulicella sp.]
MKKNVYYASLAVAACAVIAMSSVAEGQIVGRATQQDWANAGGDAQRTNWQRITPGSPASRTISPETVAGAKIDFSSPDEMSGFGLQIKAKLENTSRNLAALSGGATITAAGLGLNMGMVGASGNRTIGLDMDTGYEFYVTKYRGENPAGSLQCPGSSLATPARPAVLSIPRPAEPVPVTDHTGEIGYWSQSYAPGVGISNQRTGTGPGPITTAASPTTGARGGGSQPGASEPAAKPINAPGAAIGTGQNANGGALPESPTGRQPVLYGAVGAVERTNPIGPGAGVSNNTYTVSNDGKVHFLTQQYGLDAVEPLPFLPVGAQATDLIHLNNVLYTSTVHGCGGAPNGVWGVTTIMIPRGPGSEVDPRLPPQPGQGNGGPVAARPVASAPGLPPLPKPGQVFKWETGGTASPSPVTFLPTGVAVVSTSSGTGMGDSIITLNTPAMTPTTQAATLALSVKSKFTQAGADFVGAPIVLPSTPFTPLQGSTAPAASGGNLIAAQARDGRIFILNEELTAPLHVTEPVAGIGGYKPAGLSSWVDDTGQHWLLSTTPTSVIAYKLAINGTTASLSQGWSLTGLQAPLAPIIVNGVVFIASSGEYVPTAGANPTEAQRIANSKPAVLYAVNAVTGAKLWDSGKTITSFAPQTTALWSSLGQVILSTYDNTFYAFGANMERHSNKSIQMAH